ncbi:hypothetical protein XENOCAPTIV_021172 [Xenoophorus captivus]|uniref:Uncharacterized protein n=1 Tax=Xenoophorus captivus TaxID=1517983 RepID=A0ABV0QU31_9TELE
MESRGRTPAPGHLSGEFGHSSSFLVGMVQPVQILSIPMTWVDSGLFYEDVSSETKEHEQTVLHCSRLRGKVGRATPRPKFQLHDSKGRRKCVAPVCWHHAETHRHHSTDYERLSRCPARRHFPEGVPVKQSGDRTHMLRAPPQLCEHEQSREGISL